MIEPTAPEQNPPTPYQSNREVASAETAACVLSFLRAEASDDLVAAGVIAIGAELRIGRQTASRAIWLLIRDGWINVYRKGTGAGYPTTYQITRKSDGSVA